MPYHQGCSYPPTIENGHHTKISGLFQTVEVKYQCDEGYALVGKPTLTCSSSRWSGPAPQCKGNSSPWLRGWDCHEGIENKVSFQPEAEQKHLILFIYFQ